MRNSAFICGLLIGLSFVGCAKNGGSGGTVLPPGDANTQAARGASNAIPGGFPRYRVIELPSDFLPIRINSAGTIAGVTSDGEAALYQNGAVTRLGKLSGYPYSAARDVNDRGVAVGFAADFATSTARAVLFKNGTVTDMGGLPDSYHNAAWAINDDGVTVGYSLNRSLLEPTGAVWPVEAAPFFPLQNYPYGSRIDDINDKGEYVGSRATRGEPDQQAFTGIGNTITVLPAPAWVAARINSKGDVAGTSRAFANGRWQQYAYLMHHNGKLQLLGTLPGDAESSGRAINDSSQVVGSSGFSPNGPFRAFLYQHNHMVALNDLVPAQWRRIVEAADINNEGEIIATYYFYGYVLLVPCKPGGAASCGGAP